MKNKVLIVIILIISVIFLVCYLHSNTTLEKEVSNIVLPQNIEKIAIKSAIGDSGGNGNYSTHRVVLVVKTEMTINELKQEFEDMNLKFPNHYENSNNTLFFTLLIVKVMYLNHQESFQ